MFPLIVMLILENSICFIKIKDIRHTFAMKKNSLFYFFFFLFICTNYSSGQLQSQELEFSNLRTLEPFAGNRTSHQSIIVNNYIYVMGGYVWENNQTTVYNDVQYKCIGNDSIRNSKWVKTRSLNKRRTGLAVAEYNGFIYVLGGSDENWQYLNTVEFAKVNSDGTISANWKLSSNTLNLPRSNLSAGIYKSKTGKTFLYAIGGVGQIGSQTVHFPSVEYALINADGSLGKWSVAAYEMKGGRSVPASIIYGNKLYVVGGWGDLLFDDIFSDIQYAPITDTGSLDPWHNCPFNLRLRSYGHASVISSINSKPYIIVTGGNLGEGNTVDFIEYARIDEDFGVNPWIIANVRIDGRRWGHAATFNSGFIYITGGADGNKFFNDIQVLQVKSK
jgi:hypothetical protein